MRLRRFVVWLCLAALAAGSAYAAAGDDFYDRLYSRGLAQFNEGNYAAAMSSLRLAAFGLLEDVPRFETAQVYLTVAAMRQHHDNDARQSAQRVVAAERVERRYASLALPDSVRGEFDSAARTLLMPEQLAQLRGGATAARPQVVQPQPRPAPPPAPMPTPAPKTITIPPPVIIPAPQPQPKPAQVQAPRPQPQPVQPQSQAPRGSVETLLTDADRAINSGALAAARSLYRTIVDTPQLSHANALRAAEGAYRSRDFATATRAFQKAGAIGKGEEQYHYYYAVALYENGLYADAKRELHAALPYIEITPDVARYQTKIDGAIE